MATTFKSTITQNIGITSTNVYAPTTSSTIIGVSLANVSTASILVSATLTKGSTTVFVIKNTSIPTGNTLSLLKDSKIILENGDILKVISSSASSLDVIVSSIEVA